MKTKTTFALAALLALGTASAALAQDASKHIYVGSDPIARGLDRGQAAARPATFEGRMVGVQANRGGASAFENRLTYNASANAH
jgi:hypothetical protein